MNILVRQALIADPDSTYNGQVKDILIQGEKITSIADSITEKPDEVVECQDLIVSPGWVDPFAHFCDPGFEFRETLETGAAAAAAGGFTQVFTLPNTQPVVDNKSQVEYISRNAASFPISLHPLGAITRGVDGKELAEMYDMRNSGAIAFSDGLHPVQSPGLFLKALQYVKAFDGVLIQLPLDKSIAGNGLMHEGIVSTQLGLPGLPALAEELIIKRDIDLLRYTQSRLHITGVSTEKGMLLIHAAKEEGLSLTCSVTPYHLYFCDEDLQTYDTNLKLTPPLRSRKDMLALREGVLHGLVDCIATHHLPQDWDHKTCEFEYAKPGMIGLQTAFASILDVLPSLTNLQITELFSSKSRSIFNLPLCSIVEGGKAEMSLFSRKETTQLSLQNNRSKSANSPFLGRSLHGKVLGIIHKGRVSLNNQT